jgi:hypothetical protein
MDKALELHVLGSSQGACHPLWSQMLSHKVVKGHRCVSIYPCLFALPCLSIFRRPGLQVKKVEESFYLGRRSH